MHSKLVEKVGCKHIRKAGAYWERGSANKAGDRKPFPASYGTKNLRIQPQCQGPLIILHVSRKAGRQKLSNDRKGTAKPPGNQHKNERGMIRF
jgi:hypothetical protein